VTAIYSTVCTVTRLQADGQAESGQDQLERQDVPGAQDRGDAYHARARADRHVHEAGAGVRRAGRGHVPHRVTAREGRPQPGAGLRLSPHTRHRGISSVLC